jgi:O-acetylhomoserine (thiol)-lyase
VPIHLTTSFVFESSDHAAALFNLERAGHVYSRISNPTNAVLEQRMAALEGGIGAIATASGQAALHLAIATLMGAGSHIVASTALYGGSQNLLHYTLRRFGIETTFVKPGDIDGWRAAVRPNTKLFFGETVGNPGLDVLDIPTVSAIAHEAGVPLLVDSTLTSPWLIKPFEHGADLVYHSATKFLSGHGTVIGGVVVDGGSFDWEGPRSAGKFAELTQAYDGFHNMVFTEESTVGAFLLRARREGLRDFRRLHEPAHRLADPAGHRDPAAAHGAAHEQHRRRWWNFWPASPLCRASATRCWRATPAMRWRNSCCRAARARCSASTSRAIANRARSSSKRSKSSATWPTWATAARW